MSGWQPIETALTRQKLIELLTYNPDSGVFEWRTAIRACRVGVPAGHVQTNGYVRIRIGYRAYQAHRLAWFYFYGTWPVKSLDHINGDPADNRIANLREATAQQNGGNRKRQKNNSSGFKGVWWSKVCRRWQASIRVNKKSIHLGYFDEPTTAHAAYAAAARKFYGEFARME